LIFRQLAAIFLCVIGLNQKILSTDNPAEQLRRTIAAIEAGATTGSIFPALNDWAARIARRAGKNRLRIASEIANAAKKNWRYVWDTAGIETVPTSGRAVWQHVLGGGENIGRGDCDCITTALLAGFRAVGLTAHPVTMTGLSGGWPSHVYPVVLTEIGFVPFDLVWRGPLGSRPPCRERQLWIDGKPFRWTAKGKNR
jgi:hypothetical protein